MLFEHLLLLVICNTRSELENFAHSPVMENFPRKNLQKAKKSKIKMIKVLKTYIELAEEHAENLLPHGLTPEKFKKVKI